MNKAWIILSNLVWIALAIDYSEMGSNWGGECQTG